MKLLFKETLQSFKAVKFIEEWRRVTVHSLQIVNRFQSAIKNITMYNKYLSDKGLIISVIFFMAFEIQHRCCF